MVELIVQIKKVIWKQPRRGTIFEGVVVEDGALTERSERVVVPGFIALEADVMQPGQWWRIVGEEGLYRRSKQIKAGEALMVRPVGEHIIDLFAADHIRFPGIGKTYARRLQSDLGEQLPTLLNEKDDLSLADAMRRLGIPNADDTAHRMVEGWANLGFGEVVPWLDSLSLTEKLGMRVGRDLQNCWGAKAREKLETDPYRLIAFLNSPFPIRAWKLVDSIAQDVFKIAPHDWRRLHGAVMAALFSHYGSKNTIIDRKALLAKVKDRLEDPRLARKAVHTMGEVAIRREYTSPTFVNYDDAYYQLLAAYHMEAYVAEELARRMCLPQHDLPCSRSDMKKTVAEFERKAGHRLGDEQIHAITVCLDNTVSIITGGAGVGKTELLRCLYDIIEKQGERIIQMALAGRAARRMNEATGRPARTIAGFLAGVDELGPRMTIVIDEASMLDLPLTFQILKKVPPECRLIFVGDSEQLPPIGPGLVFHLLAKDLQGQVPAAELTKVYRQSDRTGIPAVAKAIREQRWPDLPRYSGKGEGVSIIPAKLHKAEEIIQRVYADLGGNDPDADLHILCVTRDGSPFGTSGINTCLQNTYAAGRKRVCSSNEMMGKWALTSGFSEGDPVMFTKNNWDRNLLNGTLGFIVEAYDPPRTQHDDPSAHICARIFFDTGPQDMTACDFSNLELAYAITVHKAQGSQFKRLIITIKKGHLLDKALIYTGITRGIEQVVLVGDIEAAREAVEGGAAADTRQVGLGRLLIKALAGEPV